MTDKKSGVWRKGKTCVCPSSFKFQFTSERAGEVRARSQARSRRERRLAKLLRREQTTVALAENVIRTIARGVRQPGQDPSICVTKPARDTAVVSAKVCEITRR